MTVKITKPALNLREELADLRKPSGIAGEALLRADSVQEQRDLIGAGRKNLIINGRGFIDQREKSGVSIGSYNGYGIDRWFGSNNALSFTQLSSGGFRANTTGSAAWNRFGQKIEDVYNYIGAKEFTVSFDIKWNQLPKADNAMVFFRWLHADGTTESGTGVGVTDLDKYGCNGVFEKYSATVALPDDSTAPKHLLMLIYGARGTADTYDLEIDNVQLELGSVATEYDNSLSFGEQLALCQRYFINLGNILIDTNAYTANAWNEFPVGDFSQLREAPSITFTHSGGNYYGAGARFHGGWSNNKVLNLHHRATNASVDYAMYFNNLELDSEL